MLAYFKFGYKMNKGDCKFEDMFLKIANSVSGRQNRRKKDRTKRVF